MTQENDKQRRILFAGDLSKRRHTSHYILNALKELGFGVDSVDLSSAGRARKKLARSPATGRYLCFIAIKGEGLDAATVAGLSAVMPTILWYPDFTMHAWLARLIPAFNSFFSVSRDFAAEAARLSSSTTCHWLSQGPRFHEFNVRRRPKRYSDVAFIGNLNGGIYAERRKILVSLLRLGPCDLRIWGPGLDPSSMTGEEYRALRPHHSRRSVFGRAYKDVVMNTAVIVGHDAVWRQSGYTSAKTYMILGCGGFYLTRKGGFEEGIFRSGTDLETYEDCAGLRGKIDYYLGHEEDRRRIAEQGCRTVLSRFTYRHRMEEMLAACGLNGEAD